MKQRSLTSRLALAMSLLALVLSAAGVAYAALITSSDVKDGSLRRRDMRFDPLTAQSLGADGKFVAREKSLGTGHIGRTYVRNERIVDVFTVATVTVRNEGASDAAVTYRLRIDKDECHEHDFTAHLPAGTTDVHTVSLLCNRIKPGLHPVRVLVDSSEPAIFADRMITALSLEDKS